MVRKQAVKVKTSPLHPQNHVNRFHFRNRQSRKMVMVIAAIYIAAGGLLGMFLFNFNFAENAKAGSNASVTSSIRFLEEKEYQIGEDVKFVLTLQNTSIIEPITGLGVDFYSTKDSLRWDKAENQLFNGDNAVKPVSGQFILPNLAAGERAEYIVTSTMKEKTVDYLAVMAKLKYTNEVGNQEIATNRIYTSLDGDLKSKKQPLKLASNKEAYTPGEQIVLTLTKDTEEFAPLESQLKGKIFVNQRTTGELIAATDCQPEDKGFCEFPIQNLASGNYSAFFQSEEGTVTSGINWFSVGGSVSAGKLTPSDQAALILPFTNRSINALVPVKAERVLSKNESPSPTLPCVFEVLSGPKVITSVEAQITDQRTCETVLSTSQLPAEGVYTVKLSNSKLAQEVSFVNDNVGLINLINTTNEPKKASDISLRAENIVNSEGAAVTDTNASLFIFNQQSSTLSEIKTQDGERFKVVDGVFQGTLSGSNFVNSGNYMIYLQLENGLKSNFVSISLNDTNVGYSSTGIIINDYSKLKVGQDIAISVKGLTDRNNQPIATGPCKATIYAVNNNVAGIPVDGQINKGDCNITIAKGKITKSGPATIVVSGGNNNSFSQSKQVQIAPGSAASFGDINLSYLPVRKDIANNLIIGPVRDEGGNLTNAENLKVQLTDSENQLLKEFNNLNLSSGYLEMPLPASTLNSDSINVSLLGTENQEILKKSFDLESTDKPTTPIIPEKLNSNDNLYLEMKADGESSECKFRFFQNTQNLVEQTVEKNENNICQLNWNITQLRDSSQALVQMQYENNIFSQLVILENWEAGNIFSVHPEVSFNSQNELEISLNTSPIVDKFGLPVKSGEIKWQYNGKIEKTQITNGFSNLTLPARKLESRDIQNRFDQRYLDLDLEVEASLTSISQTNNISVFLGNLDIASNETNFNLKEGSNYISTSYNKIFKVESPTCNALVIGGNLNTSPARTHKQGGFCFVQVSGSTGENSLIFENNGHLLGKFAFTADSSQQEVEWCVNEGPSCKSIEVLAPISSPVEAIIYDGENQYKFTGKDLENNVEIYQNGLNPLKEYLVEVTYTDSAQRKVSHYKEILGQRLF